MRKALEWTAGILGATNGLLITWTFAQYQLSEGESFSALLIAPGIYFLEIIIISIMALITLWQNNAIWTHRLWAANGALLGIVILGAWTIGFSLMPSFVFFGILGISMSLRHKLTLMRSTGITLTFFLSQVLFMMFLVWIYTAGFIRV